MLWPRLLLRRRLLLLLLRLLLFLLLFLLLLLLLRPCQPGPSCRRLREFRRRVRRGPLQKLLHYLRQAVALGRLEVFRRQACAFPARSLRRGATCCTRRAQAGNVGFLESARELAQPSAEHRGPALAPQLGQARVALRGQARPAALQRKSFASLLQRPPASTEKATSLAPGTCSGG